MQNPVVKLREIEPSPVWLVAKELNTSTVLDEILQDKKRLHMFILESLLRIIGPSRKETKDALVCVSNIFYRNRDYRLCFKLWNSHSVS